MLPGQRTDHVTASVDDETRSTAGSPSGSALVIQGTRPGRQPATQGKVGPGMRATRGADRSTFDDACLF